MKFDGFGGWIGRDYRFTCMLALVMMAASSLRLDFFNGFDFSVLSELLLISLPTFTKFSFLLGPSLI